MVVVYDLDSYPLSSVVLEVIVAKEQLRLDKLAAKRQETADKKAKADKAAKAKADKKAKADAAAKKKAEADAKPKAAPRITRAACFAGIVTDGKVRTKKAMIEEMQKQYPGSKDDGPFWVNVYCSVLLALGLMVKQDDGNMPYER